VGGVRQHVHQGVLGPGTILGSYRIVRLIGAGGMGAVYEAAHVSLGKPVALKTLLAGLESNREAQARFLTEGRASARIDHPHVVKVTDFGTASGAAFLVMELLQGENLSDKLARDRRLDAFETLDLLLPVMDALAEGHRLGIVHRDLKPQNIFLARGFGTALTPKLLDFGVSKIVDRNAAQNLTMSGALLGSAGYMAPEQITSAKDVEALGDQYSMALILFECLAGRPARPGNNPFAVLQNVTKAATPSLRAARHEADPRLDAAITRALSWTPSARFPSMTDFMKALLPNAHPETRAVWAERFVARASRAR
jgi:serine/threonine protein kinase